MRILFVEDDPIIALAGELALIEAGHEVIGPHASADAALQAAALEQPDVAILDIDLSGRNVGPAIAERLQNELGVRSIFASGQTEVAHKHSDVALGLLQKPYSSQQLQSTVRLLEELLNHAPERGSPTPSALTLFH